MTNNPLEYARLIFDFEKKIDSENLIFDTSYDIDVKRLLAKRMTELTQSERRAREIGSGEKTELIKPSVNNSDHPSTMKH